MGCICTGTEILSKQKKGVTVVDPIKENIIQNIQNVPVQNNNQVSEQINNINTHVNNILNHSSSSFDSENSNTNNNHNNQNNQNNQSSIVNQNNPRQNTRNTQGVPQHQDQPQNENQNNINIKLPTSSFNYMISELLCCYCISSSKRKNTNKLSNYMQSHFSSKSIIKTSILT